MKKLLVLFAILISAYSYGADLTLSWTDNSDNEAGFEIWRKINDGDWHLIAGTVENQTTFNDAVIPIGVILTYRVRAWNQFGESGFTNEVMIGTYPPAAPSGLSGQLKKSNAVSKVERDVGMTPPRLYRNSVRTQRDSHGRLVISGS